MRLLDRAFESKPAMAASTSDFVIPKVDSLVQGNKTIIRNITAIADKARRKPDDIGRYVSKELSVPISVDDQRLTVNSKFSAPDLDNRLGAYIYCSNCGAKDISTAKFCKKCGAKLE